MTPKEFEGSNIKIAEHQEEYQTLPAYANESGTIITCWKLSPEEIAKISETGELWFLQMTFNQNMQPIYPSTSREEVFNIIKS